MTTQWTNDLLRDPHHVADKRTRVQRMFAAIAPSYDLNNRLHSLWMDQRWRRKAVKLANLQPTDTIVDVACGTGDLTFEFTHELMSLWVDARWKDREFTFPDWHLIGVDFTYEMLPIAKLKSKRWKPQEMWRNRWAFINGDALSLPLPDACCDVLSIAFGIRNVSDPAAAIKEFRRVLRPNGRLIILEFSLPTNPLLRSLYNFYFRHILPRTATLISGDKTGAYKYLPESVNTFISRQHMLDMMTAAGFSHPTQHPLTFGICVCYRGTLTT